MAMTVLNNSATMISLGELNKNINKLGKSLAIVASGQKITGAKDGASEYSISEQMRSKIRALEQDIENVENGSSMLKTALGGIQNVVDELRNLKELAIDAANDSNTDDDRRVMQKVVKQTLASIDDIAAHTTFNSKRLLDGSYAEPHWKEIHSVQYNDESPNTDLPMKVMTLVKTDRKNIFGLENIEALTESDVVNKNVNINVTWTKNDVTGLTSSFEAMHGGVTFADGTRAVETRDAAPYSSRPENIDSPLNDYLVPNRNFVRASGGAPLAVKLDFSGARVNGETLDFSGFVAEQLNEQGFSIFCSDSARFVNIKFTDGSGCTWNDEFNRFSDDASGDIEYTIGLGDFPGEEYSKDQSGFANYIFDQIRDCEDRKLHLDGSEPTYKEKYAHRLGVGLDFIEDNANNISLSQQFNLRMARDGEGNVYLTSWQPYSHALGIFDDGLLQDKYIQAKDGNYYGVSENYEYKEDFGNSLWIQSGTQAGQHTNLYINGMYNSDLGTEELDVSTRDRALAAIDYIDAALEYALDQATSVGAYLERMGYTEANVETERDNVQAAESTIRDADMAKEITDYTKSNILFQASQSMLAQSNQTLSNVLGLLQ